MRAKTQISTQAGTQVNVQGRSQGNKKARVFISSHRSAPLAHRVQRACNWLFHNCSSGWLSRSAHREDAREVLRLMSRLSVANGVTLSLVQFAQERFLVASSAKGQISMLALAEPPGPPVAQVEECMKKSRRPRDLAVRS